ncbi:hypothetical protein EZV77_13850 [Burkholderia thailandensis]|nr:hypothetical protein EZV77_13850 [Burkholderia thailandensis]
MRARVSSKPERTVERCRPRLRAMTAGDDVARVPALGRSRPDIGRPPKLRAFRMRMRVLSRRDSSRFVAYRRDSRWLRRALRIDSARYRERVAASAA